MMTQSAAQKARKRWLAKQTQTEATRRKDYLITDGWYERALSVGQTAGTGFDFAAMSRTRLRSRLSIPASVRGTLLVLMDNEEINVPESVSVDSKGSGSTW